MQKKIVPLTLALLLAFSLSVSALEVTPRWGNTNDCDVQLLFSGTTANCSAAVYGKDGTNKIVVKVSLQRNNGGTYFTVKTWENTVYSDSYTLSGTSGGLCNGPLEYELASASVLVICT